MPFGVYINQQDMSDIKDRLMFLEIEREKTQKKFETTIAEICLFLFLLWLLV